MTNSLVRFAGAGASVAMLMMVGACAGEAGPPGPAGPPGGAGSEADLGKLTSSIYCGGRLENAPLSFSYDANVFANGNIFASASITDSVGSSSYSNLYAPTQKGALTASVIFARDEAGKFNNGWWEISLDRTTLITTIVNHDSDLAGGMNAWTMQPALCVVNNY